MRAIMVPFCYPFVLLSFLSVVSFPNAADEATSSRMGSNQQWARHCVAVSLARGSIAWRSQRIKSWPAGEIGPSLAHQTWPAQMRRRMMSCRV